jgi:type II secretory pathway component GspD/PulD (secretin)
MLTVRSTVVPIVLFVMLAGTSSFSVAQSDDLSRLIHPEVAERLSLDDTQRAELQQLLQRRAERLVQATEESTRQAVRDEFAEQILAVLTEEQRSRLNDDAPQQKLMFQFREMRWDEVLTWFAAQQDLTLVMDRTPGGTFTYSDTRSYSAAEGIDLLNSILLTRGFTLVRRDKMLVVMELNDSIPVELIPRVPLERLAERGKFELVSVLFPLAGRPVDLVLAEVKPYLSSFGRAVPLARGGQLLVIETAGKMATINELIASVPVPQQPRQDKPEPKPEPTFAAYPLGNLDSRATLETIRKLIPSEQITVDAKTGLLSAYVIPAQQVAIKAALEQMTAQSSERPTISTSYRYAGMKPDEIIAQIKALVPDATVTATADRVLVTATEGEQQQINTALTALNMEPASGERSFQVFQVEAAEATSLGTALQSLLSNSTVVTNPATGTLIVRGSTADLQLASRAVEMWKQVGVTDQPQLRSYELERTGDAAWLTQVSKLIPTASAWLAEDGKRLVLLGRSKDAATLQEALPELIRLLPEETSRLLRFYQLTNNQLDRRATLSDLPADLRDLKIVDGNRGELMVWGSDKQHQLFSNLLEQLDQPAPSPSVTYPKVYPITVRDVPALISILASQFPRVQFTPSGSGTELTVVASEEQHPEVSERLQALNEQLPTRLVETLASYSVSGMTTAALQQILTPLLGNARTTIDADRNRLMVWTDADKHAELAQMVAALDAAPDVMQQKVIIAYPLQHATASNAKTLIDQLVRDALVLADDKLKQVVVTGTLETQAMVKAALTQMDRAGAERQPAELRSYDVGKFQASTLVSALQPMWPDLQMSVDALANKIIASGPASAHEELLDSLDRLLLAPGGKEQTVQTYAVPAGEMSTLPAILTQLAPQALISSDPISRTVTVWASDEMHARVAQAIEKISQTAQAANEPATYIVKPNQLIAAQTSLRILFPTIGIAGDITTGQLIVVAPADMQRKVAEVVDMIQQGPNAAENSIAVLEIDPTRASLTSLLAALQATVPAQVRLESNLSNNTILAIGTPADLDKVRQRFAQLLDEMPPLPATSSRVYELQHTTSPAVVSVLATLIPGVPLAQDPTLRAFAATARDVDHEKIVEFLQAFDVARAPTGRTVQTYSVPFGEMSTLPSLIVQLAPQALISSDLTTRTVTAWADADSHTRIQQAIEKVSHAAEQATAPTSYALRPNQIPNVQVALRSLFPTLSMSADSTTGQLVVIASPEIHKRVAEVVDLLANGPGAEDRTTAVLQVDPEKTSLREVFTALQALSPPQVSLTSNATNHTILAIGPGEDLEQVQSQFTRLSEQIPAPEQRTSQVYHLMHAAPSAAVSVLTGLLPQATFVQDPTTRTVSATANPREHARISEFLEAYDVQRPSNMLTRVFSLTSGNVSSLVTAIQGFAPQASVAGDQASNSLIVTATDEELRRIEKMVQQIEMGSPDRGVTRFYPITGSEPLPLAIALKRSFPRATFAADAASGGLFATTTTEEHVDLAKVIDDLNEQPTKRPTLRSFTIQHASPALVAGAIQDAFGRRSTAGVSFNRETRSLFVVGDRDELQVAARIVEQIDTPHHANVGRRVQAFPLNGSSGSTVRQAIEGLFRDAGQDVSIQYDAFGEQLLVTANETQLQTIQETIDQFAPPQRELRIIPLGLIDPYSFKLATDALFADEPGLTAPSITIDNEQQRVLVRGTSAQLQSLQNLLEDMGGLGDASTTNLGAQLPNVTGRVRFVPMVRQSTRLLEEVQRLWPALGDNPLRVVRPGTAEPQPSQEPGAGEGARLAIERPLFVGLQTPSQGMAQQPASDEAAPASPPPIVIVAGNDRWTIASEDVEALTRLQRLVDMLVSPKLEPFATNGNFSVYLLQHAGADEIEKMLTELFRPTATGSRAPASTSFDSGVRRVKIVADSRINALIVHGSRNDRQIIEQLLGVLDSEELIDTLQQISPIMLNLRSASASNVVNLLRDVYRSQLSTTSTMRRPISIPEGVSTEVALLLQQINAQTTGPLLTIAVDEATNSIIMRAPPQLSREIQTFVEEIDQQSASTPSRRVDLIRLKSTNTKNLETALRVLMGRRN